MTNNQSNTTDNQSNTTELFNRDRHTSLPKFYTI
jgi:hypothetical protein